MIYIPSIGRWDAPITFEHLPAELARKVTLVTRPGEVADYKKVYPKVVALPGNYGYGDTMQWILDNAKERFIFIVDDDIKFLERTVWNAEKEYWTQRPASDRGIMAAFGRMTMWLKGGTPYVGLSVRNTASRVLEPYRECGRITCVHGIDRRAAKKNDWRFDVAPVMGDLAFALQVLLSGNPNRIDYVLSGNPRKTGMPGGCTETRTTEIQNASARAINSLYPYVTRLREVEKGDYMGRRLELTVMWKKAAKLGGIAV